MTDEELLKLEELEEKATPEGWVWSEILGEFGTECEGVSVHRGEDEELICDMSDETENDWRDNAELIAALRNAAKSLIASARREKELEAENKNYVMLLRAIAAYENGKWAEKAKDLLQRLNSTGSVLRDEALKKGTE